MKKVILVVVVSLVLMVSGVSGSALNRAIAQDKKGKAPNDHVYALASNYSLHNRAKIFQYLHNKEKTDKASLTLNGDKVSARSTNGFTNGELSAELKPGELKALLPNASKPLLIPTYEGSGQAVHPSIIDFKTEYNLDNWRGFRYWMAMTPYPYAMDAFENPSLIASNDGLNWVIPPGFAKPLDIKPGKADYNSDPALVYDPDENSLVVYWRESIKGKHDLIWRTRVLPTGFIEPKILTFEQPWNTREMLILSPAIWRKSAGEWYMWAVNNRNEIYLYISKDGKAWNKLDQVKSPWLNWHGGYIPWHLDVKPNYAEQRVEMLICAWPRGKTLLDMVLIYAEAPMDDLLNVSMPLGSPVLSIGQQNQWDDDFIYKPTFVIERQENSYKYRVWYSARSVARKWMIGYTEGTLATGFTGEK